MEKFIPFIAVYIKAIAYYYEQKGLEPFANGEVESLQGGEPFEITLSWTSARGEKALFWISLKNYKADKIINSGRHESNQDI